MNKIFTLLLTFILCGCTWSMTNEQIKPLNKRANVDIQSSFYLIYPNNGGEKGYFTGSVDENKESAQEAVDVFYNKYKNKMRALTISNRNISLHEGFQNASRKNAKYLITMNITDWKDAFYMTCQRNLYAGDNHTYNQYSIDSIILSIEVYDVRTQSLLNKQTLSNNGCPMVFLSLIPIGTMGPKGRFSDSLDKWEKNL